MTWALMKDYPTMSSYPKVMSSITLSVGLFVVFMTLASWILLSQPIDSIVQSYLYRVDNTGDKDFAIPLEAACDDVQLQSDGNSDLDTVAELLKHECASKPHQNGKTKPGQRSDLLSFGNITVPTDFNSVELTNKNSALSESANSIGNGSNNGTSTGPPCKASEQGSIDSECDLYRGEWFCDSSGPLYTNNSCPIITQMQNCQGNGRPDNEYERWRWKPTCCELPRFNATKFLELMSGKTLAFVGDSVARNQMQSLLCLLWQVEVPRKRGSRRMQRWHFKSNSVMIVRIWSSWLVHHTSEPGGVAKLHLDVPDETFMQFVPNFDVVVLSSGHWFAKQSVYLLNNKIVGARLWSSPQPQQPMMINNVEAFGISVETSLTAMVTHPNYTGLTIVSSYSPDHYGDGSCTGKVRPIASGQLVKNVFINSMHEKQVTGFNRAIRKQTNQSKLKLMNITEVFSYRHDGHPGPYSSTDPKKVTEWAADGRLRPQDCLHWCLPGPIDTWDEFMLEIISREFQGNQNSALQ